MIGYVRHPIGTLSLRGVNCDSIANYWKVIFQYLVRDQRVQFNVNVWVSMQLWLVSVCACVCVLVRMQLFNIHTHCYWSEVPFVRELSNCSWNQVITLRGKHKLTTSANKRCEPKEKNKQACNAIELYSMKWRHALSSSKTRTLLSNLPVSVLHRCQLKRSRPLLTKL